MVDKKMMNLEKPVNFDRLPSDLKRKIEEDVSRRQLIWGHGYGLDRYMEISKVSLLTDITPLKTRGLSDEGEDQLKEGSIDDPVDESVEEVTC